MSVKEPSLKILINYWTLWNEKNSDGSEWTLEQSIKAVSDAGFDAYTCPADTPGLKETLHQYDLRFGGSFAAANQDEIKAQVLESMRIDNGPINIMLADHDTKIEEAIELTTSLMKIGKDLNLKVHLEMHRDTCTETPEKTYAIAEGVKMATGKYPLMNLDFSHHALVKHLMPSDYCERLFANIPLFQQSNLWHLRPFNGHHCQIPITDGAGNFSEEYEEFRPFIIQAFKHWLDGPRPDNEFWIVPELGPKSSYGLSCFPNIWQDAIVLSKDIKTIWEELI